MIVNAFKIFTFNLEPGKWFFTSLKIFESNVNFAYNIFYKTRIVIGMFGNIFFITALKKTVKPARSRRFYGFNYIFNPKKTLV